MRSRRLVLVLAVALLVTACSKLPVRSGPQATPMAATEPAQVTTIRLGVLQPEPQFDQVIAAFQAKYPQYRVARVDLQTDGMTKLKDGAVDVIPEVYAWMGVPYGLSTALDPYIARSHLDLTPYGPMLDSHRIDGRQYILPVYGDPQVLAYDEQLVKAAGVAMPADGWTWEELRETAARLTHGSGDEKVWGLDTRCVSEDWAYLLAVQKSHPGAPVESQAVKSALELWNTMINTDRSVPPDMPEKRVTDDLYQIVCSKSRAALYLLPLSFLMHRPEYAGLKIAPLPAAPPNRPGTLGGIDGYGISAKAADPEAAWTFLTFLAGPDGAAILAQQGRFPAYATEATKAAWLASAPPPPPGSEVLFQTTWSGERVEYNTATPRGTFLIGARDLFLGKTTVDEALHKYEAFLAKSK